MKVSYAVLSIPIHGLQPFNRARTAITPISTSSICSSLHDFNRMRREILSPVSTSLHCSQCTWRRTGEPYITLMSMIVTNVCADDNLPTPYKIHDSIAIFLAKGSMADINAEFTSNPQDSQCLGCGSYIPVYVPGPICASFTGAKLNKLLTRETTHVNIKALSATRKRVCRTMAPASERPKRSRSPSIRSPVVYGFKP